MFWKEKSKKIFYLLTALVLLCGLIAAIAGGVVLNFKEAEMDFLQVVLASYLLRKTSNYERLTNMEMLGFFLLMLEVS